MGWSWAAACGVQGLGHIAWLPAELVTNDKKMLTAGFHSVSFPNQL